MTRRKTTAADFLLAWRAWAPADLPEPKTEVRFHSTRRWRFDYAWPEEVGGVALEIDGGQWRAGGGRHNTDEDREKRNVAAALGWRVLQVSLHVLDEDPAGVVQLCAAALVLGRVGPRVVGDLLAAEA